MTTPPPTPENLEQEKHRTQREPFFKQRPPIIVLVLCGILVGIHIILTLMGREVLNTTYYFFGFFSDQFWLVFSGQNIAPFPVLTMMTHAFLHGGWMHLGMNSIALLVFGTICARYMGIFQFVFFFLLTAMAGALVFALIRDGQGPLIGASGALFGYLAAVERIKQVRARAYGEPWLKGFMIIVVELIIINLVMTLLMSGALAWEAHLGGFIAGWLLAPYMMQTPFFIGRTFQ